MERQIALFPNGFKVDDLWVRQAEIRQLNGYDEQLLAEKNSLPSFFKTTFLLERIVNFGKLTNKLDVPQLIRHLNLGDRVALILQVRKFVFGDTMQCVLNCPNCQEPLSIDISVNSLVQPPAKSFTNEYSLKFEDFTLTLRPIEAADLEALTENCSSLNPKEKLVRLCIVSSKPALPEKLTEEFIVAVSSKLEEIDPQADIVLNLTCPSCNRPFQAPLDVESFFFEEMASRVKQLEKEIHWIALNYHWSEDSILSLPLAKRKRYIELINKTLSGESI